MIENFIKNYSDITLLNMEKLWNDKFDVPYPHINDKYLRMYPLTTNTDGFFLAILEKNKY